MAQHQRRTSSSRASATSLDDRSFVCPFPSRIRRLRLAFSTSLSGLAQLTSGQSGYDWLDPRFRTNHFIKASVLNKPAFDYSPCHLVVIVPYTFSFLRIFRSNRFTSAAKNYLVVYPLQPIIDRLSQRLGIVAEPREQTDTPL